MGSTKPSFLGPVGTQSEKMFNDKCCIVCNASDKTGCSVSLPWSPDVVESRDGGNAFTMNRFMSAADRPLDIDPAKILVVSCRPYDRTDVLARPILEFSPPTVESDQPGLDANATPDKRSIIDAAPGKWISLSHPSSDQTVRGCPQKTEPLKPPPYTAAENILR